MGRVARGDWIDNWGGINRFVDNGRWINTVVDGRQKGNMDI